MLLHSKHRRERDAISQKEVQWATPKSSPPYPFYKKLSVIIAVHNQWKLTKECLSTLLADVPDAEVIVVDNGSTDETRKGLLSFSNVRLIPFTTNYGVSKAWNAGLANATGDLLCVLNNDTIIHSGGMQALAKSAWNNGIASLMGGLINPLSIYFDGYTLDPSRADYADGCCLLFRRDIWQDVGEFDEVYSPAYCEDSDWGFRARLKGYSFAFVPDAITHLGGQTSIHDPSIVTHHKKNQAILQAKWKGMGIGERIKITRWGATGDVLMATPAIAALRRSKPLSRIHLQCAPQIAHLLQGLSIVDVVDSGTIDDYNRVYDLDNAYEDQEARGFWMHPVMAFAQALKVSIAPEFYHVPAVTGYEQWARDMISFVYNVDTKYIACGLRSAYRSKANWNSADWGGLFIASPDYKFVLLDSCDRPNVESHIGRLQQEQMYDLPNVIDLTGKTPTLRHTLAILRLCNAAVSVDTGILHLANAAHCPVIGLFGGAPGWARMPLVSRNRCIQGVMDCYPCRCEAYCNRKDGTHCLDWVTGREVARQLKEIVL